MGVMTVAIGLMVSYLSAVSLLGISAEVYTYGTHYFVIVLGYIIATPFVGYFYLPVFFKLEATSAFQVSTRSLFQYIQYIKSIYVCIFCNTENYLINAIEINVIFILPLMFQYLEERFGFVTRIVVSFAFLSQFLLYTSVVVYAPALALEATTGLSTPWNVAFITLVCTFYSTIGGIKAVLITDVFQAILMIVSIGIIIVKAVIDVGSIDELWRIADRGGRIDYGNFSIDPTTRHTWWSLVIGGTFIYLSLYAVNQVQVQRLLTIR